MILFAITIILFTAYAVLILFYRKAWKTISEFKPDETTARTSISVIIPARNEEENIERLLSALQRQAYPSHLFEVIVVDDNSTDKTAAIAERFSNVKLIHLKETNINSYKKKAIEEGIAASKHELIITTDADCVPGENWLATIASFKEEKDPALIAGPVVYESVTSLFEVFQSLDFLTLQGITGASLHRKMYGMGNGANLAYEKKAFNEVNGFSSIDNIASGDDMLLIQKILDKYPGRVYYLKSTEAIVATKPSKTWKEFFNQRIRWASKATHYKNGKIILILSLVYLFNLLFPVLIIAGLWNHWYWWTLPVLLLLKTLIEYSFIYTVAYFFNQRSLLRHFFLLQLLHILYTLLSGFLGQWGKYEWKGRRVS